MKKSVESPTGRLLAGLAVTLAAVGVFSFYALGQIRRLEDLQTRTVDRNRKDSLQLLRIQNDLNQLGMAMRDMLYNDEPYPLAAYKKPFDSRRADLDTRSKRRRNSPRARAIRTGSAIWPDCWRSSGRRPAVCSTWPRKGRNAPRAI